jgi:hypothetical protein
VKLHTAVQTTNFFFEVCGAARTYHSTNNGENGD